MRRVPWWVAVAFAVSVGCGGAADTNPNEIDFPGAPGSRVAAPKAVERAEGGGPSTVGSNNLPSTYPGNEPVGKGASKDDSPEAKPEAKPEAGSAPGTEPKETPAPAEPDAGAGGRKPQ